MPTASDDATPHVKSSAAVGDGIDDPRTIIGKQSIRAIDRLRMGASNAFPVLSPGNVLAAEA